MLNGMIDGNQAGASGIGGGGGLYVSDAASDEQRSLVHLGESCHITGNQASYFGGGLYVNQGTTMLITEATVISGNMGSSGGGIFSAQSSMQLEQGVMLTNNSAQDHGGALGFIVTIAFLQDLVLQNNQAGYNGAGIYNYASYVVISDSILTQHVAVGRGGAVFVTTRGQVQMNRCNVEGNMAKQGGAFAGDQQTNFALNNSVIKSNLAYGEGGAHAAVDSTLTALNTSFSTNRANLHGGGIALFSKAAVSLESCSLAENAAPQGGGISVVENPKLLHIRRSSFDHGQAEFGIGILMRWPSIMSETLFEGVQFNIDSGECIFWEFTNESAIAEYVPSCSQCTSSGDVPIFATNGISSAVFMDDAYVTRTSSASGQTIPAFTFKMLDYYNNTAFIPGVPIATLAYTEVEGVVLDGGVIS
ncbi:hypothetical protein CYMTET_51992, partial [Cymbomonas tetramitiformis]